jgi:hypothetical protein
MWLKLLETNITLKNFILVHTYNYSGWTGDLSNSLPLIWVDVGSIVLINNLIITSAEQSSVYRNPVILGMGISSSVQIEYCTFANISLSGVSLVHDYYSTPFSFINVTFWYDKAYLLDLLYS